MTLKRYYENLKSPQIELREKIMQECFINKATFYRWLNNPETIPPLAKIKIAEIFEKPIDELFPEMQTQKS